MELSHPDAALSTLLGVRVTDDSGRRLGRVRDVRARWGPSGAMTVEAVVVGRRRVVIPWSHVRSLANGTLVVTVDPA